MRTTLFFQRHVGWTLQISCLILPVLIALSLTFLILSPPTFPALAMYEFKGSVYSNGESGILYPSWTRGGCMKYDHEKSICKRTLQFKPSASYLHLPPDETFIEKFPTMGWMAFLYVALALVGLGIISFSLGPFVPDCYFISTGLLWIASIYSPIFVLMGMGYGLTCLDMVFIFAIPFLIVSSTAIITQICSKIKLQDPPGESADRTTNNIDIELQVQPSIDKCGD
ncbi:hypothetical protein I203_101444 [Kwoniella mangroviensis CBS 8507]|uniref:uncharacterized protein n=1 Tax=Kwoniella mangroviensis CBS 8507 TaxID=1296122 RepID=UPI0030487A2B